VAARRRGDGADCWFSTTLRGRLALARPPKPLFALLEVAASCAGVALAVTGVVTGDSLGVERVVSMRDFLFADRGVTLLLSMDLAGVERSSIGERTFLGVETSDRGDFVESAGLVVALRCWTAKRGVIGDLTAARFEARVGINGREGRGGLVVLDLSTGIVARWSCRCRTMGL
jgi:hypothetical protein